MLCKTVQPVVRPDASRMQGSVLQVQVTQPGLVPHGSGDDAVVRLRIAVLPGECGNLEFIRPAFPELQAQVWLGAVEEFLGEDIYGKLLLAIDSADDSACRNGLVCIIQDIVVRTPENLALATVNLAPFQFGESADVLALVRYRLHGDEIHHIVVRLAEIRCVYPEKSSRTARRGDAYLYSVGKSPFRPCVTRSVRPYPQTCRSVRRCHAITGNPAVTRAKLHDETS